jgi:hypothetical protein
VYFRCPKMTSLCCEYKSPTQTFLSMDDIDKGKNEAAIPVTASLSKHTKRHPSLLTGEPTKKLFE